MQLYIGTQNLLCLGLCCSVSKILPIFVPCTNYTQCIFGLSQCRIQWPRVLPLQKFHCRFTLYLFFYKLFLFQYHDYFINAVIMRPSLGGRINPLTPTVAIWVQLNPVWHRMLYSCTHMATMGVKGLSIAPRRSIYLSVRPSRAFDLTWSGIASLLLRRIAANRTGLLSILFILCIALNTFYQRKRVIFSIFVRFLNRFCEWLKNRDPLFKWSQTYIHCTPLSLLQAFSVNRVHVTRSKPPS